MKKEYDIEVDWRGFELHSETPPGGMLLTDIFPAARLKAMHEQLKVFAAGFGIHDMKLSERLPNTRLALAMAEFARDEGKLDMFRAVVMEAYWQEGKDLENEGELRLMAERSGMDPNGAVLATKSSLYLKRVDALGEQSCKSGITGIPTFFIGRERIEGCQPYQVLAAAVRRAGAAPRG